MVLLAEYHFSNGGGAFTAKAPLIVPLLPLRIGNRRIAVIYSPLNYYTAYKAIGR